MDVEKQWGGGKKEDGDEASSLTPRLAHPRPHAAAAAGGETREREGGGRRGDTNIHFPSAARPRGFKTLELFRRDERYCRLC